MLTRHVPSYYVNVSRRRSTSAAVRSSVNVDDPCLSNNHNDYEWLKQSRPMRIYARSLNGGDGSNNIPVDSSSVTAKKVVHFQRHGQGTHNALYKQFTDEMGEPPDLAETDPKKNPLLLEHIVDAPLTQKGKDQCAAQRYVASKLDGVELIICSPLVRTLQTAHITFENHLDCKNVKWIAHEGVREEFGTLLCNKRRPLSETRVQFPKVDYTYMPQEQKDDILWNKYVEENSNKDGIPKREELVDISHRAYHFLVNFLLERPEKEMVVVGHSHWFHAMTNGVLDVGDDTSMTAMFGQAELKSFELVFTKQ